VVGHLGTIHDNDERVGRERERRGRATHSIVGCPTPRYTNVRQRREAKASRRRTGDRSRAAWLCSDLFYFILYHVSTHVPEEGSPSLGKIHIYIYIQ
jgi:hypothetical protein